ncbi:GxxExxY protein [bacterium]|nr:GxxExxY protein [bacterium]
MEQDNKDKKDVKDNYNEAELTKAIIGCCYEVMNELGVGFLEKVYENALIVVLEEKGLAVQQQVPLKVKFRGKVVGHYQADIVVNQKVLLELKVCEGLTDEHRAQALNYLKATGYQVALLINFRHKRVELKRLYNLPDKN